MTYCDGVLGCFQDGRERLPAIVAEIRLPSTRGDHQIVVGDALAKLTQLNAARLTIDGLDAAELDTCVAMIAHDLPDRHRDIG